MIVRGATTVPVDGSSIPTDASSAAQRRGEQQPAEDAEHRREEADHERLDDDGVEHLAARRAERPQQRELARALRDRDREGVEDQEAADEHGDAGEHEQRDREEAERLADVGGGLLGLLLAGADVGGAAERAADRRP